MSRPYSWSAIARIGLIQAAIGAIVVLMTSVINRVMVVELALPASIPAVLVAIQFGVQLILRPQVGHWSDQSGRRSRWIAGGLVLLAMAGIGAAGATALIAEHRALGFGTAAVAFVLVGAGVSMAGTPLLAMLSERVEPDRRPRAAATVWLMMIAGFVIATVAASGMLEPFSYRNLVVAVAVVSTAATAVALVALVGLEPAPAAPNPVGPQRSLIDAVRVVWRDPVARTFVFFIGSSMLAYSAQDLILEPFGGLVFGLSPAESTRVSSMHQGGMLVGMIGAALLAARFGGLRQWTVAGCAGSAVAFVGLAFVPAVGDASLLRTIVPLLGLANGVFAVGAVGSMMSLSVAAGTGRAGIRMGVFGAAQAIASALGGSLGAVGSDLARYALGNAAGGYAVVFAAEAGLFAVAAALALRSVPAGRQAVAEPGARPALEATFG